MAKSDRLLQAVLERPDDDSVLDVYADALQAAGEPRGALVSVQRQRERASDAASRRLLKQQEQELLSEHHARLLGPLVHLGLATAVWRRGFVRELHVMAAGRDELGALGRALRSEQCAMLERLTVRAEEPEALIGALPPRLWHLSLASAEAPWDGVLEALPPLRSLEIWGGHPVDFEGLQLPALERLWLTHEFAHLGSRVVPKLERLTLGDGSSVPHLRLVPPGLKLLRLLGSVWTDVPLPAGVRCIHEWDADQLLDDDEVGSGTISRGGFGVAGERALLLTLATAAQVDAAFEPFARSAGPHQLTLAPVTLGALLLLAVEVRVARPRRALLGELAEALQTHGQTLEVAASHSNDHVLLRGFAGGAGRSTLSTGTYASREDVWRAGVDRALGFDPGRTYDVVCEALDAANPRRHTPEARPPARGEWPCATPLEPRPPDEPDDVSEPMPDWWR